MKLNQLLSQLNKLNKKNPDANVNLGFSTLIGPQFDDPAIVEADDGIYIVPQAVETGLEKDSGREQIGAQVQKIHAEWQQQQDAPQGDAG